MKIHILLTGLLLISACKKEAPTDAPQTVAQTAAQTAAQPEPAKTWALADIEKLTEPQKKQLDQAQNAQKYLGTILVQKVSSTATEKGFPAAIDVCSAEAKQMAEQVGTEKGVKIGRTSDKLRNPSNTAPEWFSLTQVRPSEKPAVLTGPHGELGWVVPIRTAELCVNCHGTPETIHPEVAGILKEKYPEDQAMGYATGDLRGWFWVEVPAS